MTINSFQNLTDSAIAYGVRTYLNVRYCLNQNEEEKDKMKEKINHLTDENIKLKEYNLKLEEEIKARVERFVVNNILVTVRKERKRIKSILNMYKKKS
jgi:hypothetical protein